MLRRAVPNEFFIVDMCERSPEEHSEEFVTAGIVLAAGAGRRYGRPKIVVGNWLETAVEALVLGGCSSVAVVTGAQRVTPPLGADEVYCADWDQGMGTSLKTGLQYLCTDFDRVAIHLVDCPDIGPDVVARLLADSGMNMARAVFNGTPGHPVILPADIIDPLIATLTGRRGAGPFLAQRTVREVECGDLATGADIDIQQGRMV